MFDYDSNLPLDFQEHNRKKQDGTSIIEVSYASPHGGRVSSYMILPDRGGRLSAVLFMHPSGTSKHAFLKEAGIYARAGCASLLIDGPNVRIPARPILSFTERDRDDHIQAVVDLRRGVDLLIDRPDIDGSRIGFVGFSYGAIIGAMLAGVERRIKTYILWACSARMTCFLRNQGKSLPKKDLEAYLHLMEVINPIQHVKSSSPSSLLFQNGRKDKYATEDEVAALYQAASEPKQLEWYDAGHALDGRACQKRFEWMQGKLKLDPLEPEFMKELAKFKLKQMANPL